MANKIKYSDIIDQSVQDQLDSLAKTIADLTKELQNLKTATVSEEATNENFNESLKDSVEVTEDLLRLTQEEIVLKKNLTKTQKNLDKALEDGSITADKYAIALKVGKEELSKMGFQLKNNTKLTLANRSSMTELSLQLAKNRMKYRDLTKAERENEKIGVKLLRTIQKQDKEIKKLDKSIGNAQRNVGNYTKAMGKASTAGRKFGTTMKIAVVGAVIASAKEMQAAADFMSLGANVAVAAVGNMQKLAKGELSFAEAFDLNGIYEVAKALTLVSKESRFLQALENQRYTDVRFHIEQQKVLRDDERASFADRINASTYLNTLLEKSDKIIKDSFLERRKEFDEILKNDKDNIAAQTDLLTLEVEKNNKLRENVVQRNESQRATIRLYKEEENAVLNLQSITDEASRNRLLSSNFSLKYLKDIQLSIMTQEVRILDERMANEEKYSDKWYDLLAERKQRFFDYSDAILDIQRQSAELQTDTIINTAQTAVGIASTLAGDNKEIQTATALVNTFAGVSQALASAPPPYNFIQAALVLAAGLANVVKIQNTDVPTYATGTESVPGTGTALIHEGERILPSHINQQLGSISNDQVPGLINLGLQTPELRTGIGELVGLQRESNKLMGRFAWVDGSGTVHKLNGDQIYYS